MFFFRYLFIMVLTLETDCSSIFAQGIKLAMLEPWRLRTHSSSARCCARLISAVRRVSFLYCACSGNADAFFFLFDCGPHPGAMCFIVQELISFLRCLSSPGKDNKIGTTGASSIAGALEQNSTLRSISLNSMSHAGRSCVE